MDLDFIRPIFEAAASIRNKYPTVKRHIRHLETLFQDRDKGPTQDLIRDEVEKMKAFLLGNSSYQEGTFDQPLLRGKKETIDMAQVHNLLSEEHKVKFLGALQEAERNLFPGGKPAPVAGPQTELSQLIEDNSGDNGFLGDIMSNLKDLTLSENLNPSDLSISEIISNPGFLQMANNFSDKINKGQWKRSDLEKSIDRISDMIQKDPNPEAMAIINKLKGIMGELKEGRQPDLSEVLNCLTPEMMSTLTQNGDLSNLNQPLVQSIMNQMFQK